MSEVELVTMTRGAGDIAIVRLEWVEEWRGYGYVTQAEADAPADEAAATAPEKPAKAKKMEAE